MILEESTLQAAYVVSVASSIALCGVLWRYRTKTGAVPLFFYVFSGFLWGGTQLTSVTIDDYAISVALHRFLFLGIALGVAALFVFALEYTGRERYLGPMTYLALSIHPLFIVVFAVVDPGGYFLGTIESDPSRTLGIAPEYGIAMLVHLVYTYALVTASALMFVDMLYRTRSLYRGQSLALLGGAILPACGPLPQIFGLVTFDPTPFVIPIASGLFTIAIIRYRLIDLVPIARNRVLDTVNDGVFVVDDRDRLIDVNPTGRRMLRTVGIEDETLVGRHFPSLLGATDLRQQYETVTDGLEETSMEVSIGSNYFQITATPIDDGRDRHVGWLAITHDVTERKRREETLERQNRRLEQFADLVSHDLRNPLTVASGYLELARETDDNEQHFERIERAHDRMETIIDDVLTLAREGAAVTDPQPVELGRVAEGAWSGVATGDATLDVRSSAPILADQVRLRRLLENLFRNTVEHGPADDGQTGVVVTVGVNRSEDADGTTVYVEDDGCGIPADQRDRVFEGGYTTGDEGTGFGLSIVQQIAEAHGWAVTATEGMAGGARFEFSGVESGVIDGETGADDDSSESLESSESIEWVPDTS